ncbi:50S ribosomal protein L9 [Euzebya sp.]|uniref:50S ribosomal protein L9 n=1 Tax=Euzebya sp. TaxID=1971409 RepID=UPI003518730C
MKVILKGYVDNLGDAGDIVEVANGYANNFLIPQNLAMRATKGAVADSEALMRSRQKREAVEIAQAEEQAKGLSGRVLVIQATAGEDGTLYGSVGKRDVADALASATGVTVDSKKIDLDRPIKAVGQHEVGVRLHREVVATVTVDVVADEVIESGSEVLEEALAEDAVDEADVPATDPADTEDDEV